MNTRTKFFLLIGTLITSMVLVFTGVWHSPWAKSERAWFQDYPHRQLAMRSAPPPARFVTPVPVSKTSEPPTITDAEFDTIMAIPVPEPVGPPAPMVGFETLIEVVSVQRRKRRFSLAPKITAYGSWKRPPPPIEYETVQVLRRVAKPVIADEHRIIPQPRPVMEITPKRKPARNDSEKGYLAYEKQQYTTAISFFEKALQTDPNNINLITQLAYAHKIIGDNDKALTYFKRSLDHHQTKETTQDVVFPLKREVELIENRWTIDSYAIYRDQDKQGPLVPLIGPNLVTSQIGAEISYQPPHIGFRNGRTFQVFARLLGGLKDQSLSINNDSYQAGIGIRYRPFSKHNLVLAAERLIRVGDNARNDWMLRSSYSYDRGTDIRYDRSAWWTMVFYADAAFIRPSDPDIFLTGQATIGRTFRLSDELLVRPHMVVYSTWQKDSFRTSRLTEAGPGLSAKFFFNDTRYGAFRSHIEITADYRFRIGGNSLGGSGPVISLLFRL